MENFFLTPKDGRNVRDPLTGKALPAQGASKPKTAYWIRRVRDGDVEVGKAPATADTSAKGKQATVKVTVPANASADNTKGEAK